MSNYERYIVKENACLKKRMNWNTKKHHNKLHHCVIEAK